MSSYLDAGGESTYEGIATAFERRSMKLSALVSTYFWNFSRSDMVVVGVKAGSCPWSSPLPRVVGLRSQNFNTCITELYSTRIHITATPYFISTLHVEQSGALPAFQFRVCCTRNNETKQINYPGSIAVSDLKYGWTWRPPHRSR